MDSTDVPMTPKGSQDQVYKMDLIAVDAARQQEEYSHKEVVSEALGDLDSDPEDENYKPKETGVNQSDEDEDDETSISASEDSDSDSDSLTSLNMVNTRTAHRPHVTTINSKSVENRPRDPDHFPTPSRTKASAVPHELLLKNFFLEDYCLKAKKKNEKLKKKCKHLKYHLHFNDGNINADEKKKKALHHLIHEQQIQKKLIKKTRSINILKARLRKKDEKICEYQINYRIEINRLRGEIRQVEENMKNNHLQHGGRRGGGIRHEEGKVEETKMQKMVRLLVLIQTDQTDYIHQLEAQILSLESQIKTLEANLFPF